MSAWRLDPNQPVDAEFDRDPAAWLAAEMQQRGARYLLAYADDGVIWGRLDDGLHLSGSVGCGPALRGATLRECRLFGPEGELLLWRTDAGWRARWLADGDEKGARVDEYQVLWGDRVERTAGGFTVLVEGSQGLRHAPPLAIDEATAKARNLRLLVRHYIDYNDDGEARIALSRLVDLVGAK